MSQEGFGNPEQEASALENPDSQPTESTDADVKESTQKSSSREPTGRFGNILKPLLDGSAEGPTVGEVQSDYDIEDKGLALMVRAGIRAGTGEGVPPIVEFFIGFIMYQYKQSDDADDEGPEFNHMSDHIEENNE